jgi:hypothetical protein
VSVHGNVHVAAQRTLTPSSVRFMAEYTGINATAHLFHVAIAGADGT